ncbi:DEAD/DEAH box helicase [[Mycoplasma] testudinis]|uniref:DEAD/DEAH box helicase n=1 Tax=[Mycoplasma] testudinis TaxID=33924 RepID=UPI000695C8C1|nr:DEAD/DEAH box helicase [[Mycoplasma] testudinis]
MTRREIEEFIGDEIIFVVGLNLLNRKLVSTKNMSDTSKTKQFTVFGGPESFKVSIELDESNNLKKFNCNCFEFSHKKKKCSHLAACLLKLFPSQQKKVNKKDGVAQESLDNFKVISCKKARLLFDKTNYRVLSGENYSCFSLSIVLDEKSSIPVSASLQMFANFSGNSSDLINLIELDGTGFKLKASSFNIVDLKILKFLLKNTPKQITTIKDYDAITDANSFWISPKLVLELFEFLKVELNLENASSAVIEYVNEKASAFRFVSTQCDKRIVLQHNKLDTYITQIQFFVNNEWMTVRDAWTDNLRRLFLLENSTNFAHHGKYSEVVNIASSSFAENYMFYHARGITDYYLFSKNNALKKLFEFLPKATFELAYNPKTRSFERKVKFLYFNEGLPFSVLSTDTENLHSKERLYIYEQFIVEAADSAIQTKQLARKSSGSKITSELMNKINQDYRDFYQTEMVQYKVSDNLLNEGFLNFDYSDLKKITIQKGNLLIRCNRVNFSISEISNICKEFNGTNDVIITKNCFYKLQTPENKLFCKFWSKFDFYNAKSDSMGTFEFPKFRAFDLLLAFDGNRKLFEQYADPSVVELIKAFKDLVFEKMPINPPFDKLLRPYQTEGHYWLRTLQRYSFGGILADDMGLGKTVQTISVIAQAYASIPDDIPSLIVVPTSLLLNWQSEFKKFAPKLKVTTIRGLPMQRQQLLARNKTGIEITSYSYFRRDIEEHQKKIYKFVVIDEAQNIKNHASHLSLAIKTLQAEHRLALTGTPIENKLIELWSIFDFILPGLFGSSRDFIRDYERPITKDDSNTVVDRLKQKINTFILRRTKDKVLSELPPKTETDITVELSPEHRKIYDERLAASHQYVKGLIDSNKTKQIRFEILKLIIELRQICCSPKIKKPDFDGENTKFDACLELIEESIENHKKVLVFTQFLGMIDLFKKELKKRKINFFVLSGETKKDERMAAVNDFNNDDTPVFIASLRAGGVGLNLVGAEVVIHYDLWWNIAVQNQATDRVHRIGQKKAVQVYRIIVDNSIEQRIIRIQDVKKHLSKSVINDDKNILASLSINDLVDLFDPNKDPTKNLSESVKTKKTSKG